MRARWVSARGVRAGDVVPGVGTVTGPAVPESVGGRVARYWVTCRADGGAYVDVPVYAYSDGTDGGLRVYRRRRLAPHVQLARETYRAALDAWHALRESSTVAPAAYGGAAYMQLDADDYRAAAGRAPRFADHLRAAADSLRAPEDAAPVDSVPEPGVAPSVPDRAPTGCGRAPVPSAPSGPWGARDGRGRPAPSGARGPRRPARGAGCSGRRRWAPGGVGWGAPDGVPAGCGGGVRGRSVRPSGGGVWPTPDGVWVASPNLAPWGRVEQVFDRDTNGGTNRIEQVFDWSRPGGLHRPVHRPILHRNDTELLFRRGRSRDSGDRSSA